MSLNARREQVDQAALEAGLRGARLRRRVTALRECLEPHRAGLTVATGLFAGALASLLPLRAVMRAGTLGMDAFLLIARLLPQRMSNPPAHATGVANAAEPVRDA